MASIGQLKTTSVLTIMGLLGTFFIFIVVLALMTMFAVQDVYSGVCCFIFMFPLVIIWAGIQYVTAPWVVKWATRMKSLKKGDNEFFESTVNELCQTAGIKVPKLGIVENPNPNAFVFGNKMAGYTLAVHTGLLETLNKDEIRAVIGHEVGHIKNGDCDTMTFLSVLPMIASYIAIGALYATRGAGRSRNGGGLALFLIAVAALAGLTYLITAVLVKYLSRIREYYADAYSALITDPTHLASALAKITYGLSLAEANKENKGVRSFYINDAETAAADMAALKKGNYDLDGDGVLDENELEKAMADESNSKWRKVSGIMASHPPTYRRILNLKAIAKDMKGGEGQKPKTEAQVYEKVDF